MGKNPAFQFYPSDWQRDLDDHPLEIEGAWIRICGRLFWTGGKSTKNLEEWARILRKNSKKTLEILLYLQTKNIGDLVIQNNEITITCRRMVRDENIRKIRTNAGIKGGNPILLKQKKDSICLTKIEANSEQNAEQNLTPSSSSSFSSSKNKEKIYKKEKKFIPPSEQDVIDFFLSEGFPLKLATHVFKYYSDSDWHDSKGNPVKVWKSKCRAVWMKPENKAWGNVSYPRNVMDKQAQACAEFIAEAENGISG
jgi:hypothetical protein